MSRLRTELMTGALAAALFASACPGDGPFDAPRSAASGHQHRAYVPPTRSISGAVLDAVEEARQLGGGARHRALPAALVIGAGVTRNAQGGPGVTVHVVQRGAALAGIVAGHGVTPAGPGLASPAQRLLAKSVSGAR